VKVRAAKLAPYLIAFAVTGLVAALAIYERTHPEFTAVRKLEWITYDWRVRAALDRPALKATNLGTVLITDDSIAQVNREREVPFPWPRNIYEPLLDELRLAGVKAVGFDILFAERHPDEILAKDADGEVASTDHIFASALRRSSNVLLAADSGLLPAPLFRTNALGIADIQADKDSDGALRRVKPFRKYRLWHTVFEQLAANPDFQLDLESARIENGKLLLKQKTSGDAIPPIPLDAQGNFNIEELIGELPPGTTSPLAKPFDDMLVWHLGVRLAALSLGADLSRAAIEADRVRLLCADGSERVIPLDDQGYFYIDWNMTPNDPALATASFLQVWEEAKKRAKGEETAPDWKLKWRDRVVVVGSTATGNNVADVGPTPIGRETYLVSKHWNVANSIITGRFVQRMSGGMELLLIAALGFGAAAVTWRLRAPWPTVWVMLAAAVYVGVAFLLYVQQRYWLPIVLPVAGAMVLNHLGVEIYRVVFEQKEKRRVKSVFAKLVSPNVVDEMLKSEHINLGGSRRQITVFFADVRGFTSMTDEYAAKAEEYVRTHHLEGEAAEAYYNQQAAITLETVNMYLSTIADKVKEHKGTLDKYMGDCVMAFWGMPTLNPQHALSCVRAAIDAQRAMSALNQKRLEENKQIEAENLERIKRGEEQKQLNTLLALGTGINTGYAIIGLMGSEKHILNYTVFGREVNIASRLEGVSGRGRIIIGEATYRDILRDDPALAGTCIELEPVMVKGIKKPVRIYEVPWKQEAEKGPEQSADAASTGFFRLEAKDTVMLTKPSDTKHDKPAEPEAPKPS
jgi:class 3 adenylate cyclase/CHASE2 domain-containing sensor protein